MDLSATYFGNTILQYVIFFSVVAGGVMVGKLITWTSKTILRAIAGKTKTRLDDIILTLLEGPVLFTVFILGLYFGQNMLYMSEGFAAVFSRIISILFIVNIAWYLTKLINGLIEHYLSPITEKSETDLDDHLLPIARKLVNFIVWAIVSIMIVEKLGYNVSSLIAGLGIGGLAFALAAKDLVGNLFGGLAILMDKPFKVGDRIKAADVDGFVREIGLRTTRIETFGGTMITIPNSKIVDSVSENVSAEKERRMTFTIGVEYSTSLAKLEKGKKIIESHLKKIKGLDNKNFSVSFSEFAASSLNIRVQYWITPEGMNDYFGVQDKLYMAIKKDFEKAKIEMAFPTQTVHVKK